MEEVDEDEQRDEARFRLDPIDVFHDALGSVFGRLVLFFSSGWVGFVIGRTAAAFESIDDFLEPLAVFRSVLGESSLLFEALLTAFWPLTALLSAGASSVPLFFVILVPVILFAFVFLFTDSPSPLWWLGAVATTSLIPPLAWQEPRLISVGVLAIFWLGLAAAAWWVIIKQRPDLPETLSGMISGTDPVGEIPRRKAPPNAWGRPVEGVEDSGSEE